MSETPRTDAAILDYHGMVVEEEGCVPAALCRKFERELNELNAWKAGMKGVEEFYALRSQYRTYVLAMNRIIMACEATKDCQNQRMDDFVVAQIERLRKENEELKAWREGQKGIEDYYIVKEKLYVAETAADSWRKCAERLAASLRSEMRGEDARYSETGRLCAESDLEEFEKLKAARSAALPPSP